MCTLNNNIETHIHKNVLGQIHGQIREIHPLRWDEYSLKTKVLYQIIIKNFLLHPYMVIYSL